MSDLEQSADAQNSDEVQDQSDEVVETSDESTEAEQSDEDSQEQTEEEENEEIDVDGRKVALPKSVAAKLQAERLMQADYTRKTQELAAAREQHQEAVKTREVFMADYAKVQAISQQLAEIDKINLADFVESDPIGVQKVQVQRQQLEAERNKLIGEVTQKQQQYELDEKQNIANLSQQAEAYVQREIKGWSAARSAEIKEYAEKSGVKMDKELALSLIRNPALLALIDKAEKFDQLAKKTTAKAPPAPPPKPATRITSGKQTANVDPDKMSAADYVKWRRGGK